MYVRWSEDSSCPSHSILDKQEDSSDDDEAEEGEVEDETTSDVEVSRGHRCLWGVPVNSCLQPWYLSVKA